MGDTKGGAFDIPGDTARDMLRTPGNPNGHPNADVIVPWVNGLDITRRPRDMFIIDFGVDMSQNAAARYEAPFAHVKERVAPVRAGNKREQYKSLWWIHVEPRPALRAAIKPLPRLIVTHEASVASRTRRALRLRDGLLESDGPPQGLAA